MYFTLCFLNSTRWRTTARYHLPKLLYTANVLYAYFVFIPLLGTIVFLFVCDFVVVCVLP